MVYVVSSCAGYRAKKNGVNSVLHSTVVVNILASHTEGTWPDGANLASLFCQERLLQHFFLDIPKM